MRHQRPRRRRTRNGQPRTNYNGHVAALVANWRRRLQEWWSTGSQRERVPGLDTGTSRGESGASWTPSSDDDCGSGAPEDAGAAAAAIRRESGASEGKNEEDGRRKFESRFGGFVIGGEKNCTRWQSVSVIARHDVQGDRDIIYQ